MSIIEQTNSIIGCYMFSPKVYNAFPFSPKSFLHRQTEILYPLFYPLSFLFPQLPAIDQILPQYIRSRSDRGKRI